MRHRAIAYRARALDAGAWRSLAREIFQEGHRAHDLIRMGEQKPEPAAKAPARSSNVITFAERAPQRRERKTGRGVGA